MGIRRKSEQGGDVMNKNEVKEHLGVSHQSLERLMKEGNLPYRQVGRIYLFSKKAVDEWLARSDDGDNK